MNNVHNTYPEYLRFFFCVQGPRPKMGASTFEDLLPEGSSFTKKEDEPKTIGEMKKKTMAEETDPTKLKVVFNIFFVPLLPLHKES